MSKILELKNKNKKVGSIEIKNSSRNKSELYFYGDIVSSTWGCWESEDRCPQDVTDFLKNIDDNSDIDIYINSGGGSVFAGLAIYNQLKRYNGFKTVYVDGIAASISSVIALAGDRIVIPKNALFMIHKPWSSTWGNANDLRKMADSLDACEESILAVYKENLKEGVDIETIKEMVNNETWLTGEQAEQYFNIETYEGLDVVACTSDYFNNYKKIPSEIKSKKENDSNKELESKKAKLLLELDLI